MKRRTTSRILLASLTCGLAGCHTGMIRVSEIAPSIQTVADRHDEYVRGDESLTDMERTTYLRTTELLRAVIDEAKKSPTDQ